MKLSRVLAALAVAAGMASSGLPMGSVQAQGIGGGDVRGQSDVAGTGDEFRKPGAQFAFAGAGTDDGATTGVSGPDQGGGGPIEVPPLPSADVCEPYLDTSAYQSCLWVVLRDQ